MEIQPFAQVLTRQPGDNKGIVKPKGFWRRLAKMRDFTISAPGFNLSMSKPDTLVISPSSAAASSAPFAVTVKGTSIIVAPGLVYSTQAYDTPNNPSGLGWCVPVIGGVALDHTPAPSVAYDGTSDGFVCLVASFAPSGEVTNWPWPVIFSTSAPVDTTIVRDTGANPAGNAPRAGVYNLMLASIKGGKVNQWVRGNMCATLQWQQLLIFG